MRALLRLIPAIEGREIVRAPAGIFDRVRAGGAGDPDDGGGAPAEGA
jgi:hypothetical protein